MEEDQYLNLIKQIIQNGKYRIDRTRIGTISIFGTQSRYNLRNNILPLLTTKNIFVKGVIEELLWFIKGSTNSKELSSKGIYIWDKHGSKEFLNKQGFYNRKEGDLGPIYGFQWKHFGDEYKTCDDKYKGFDQLNNCIHLIKTDPFSRRIIMTSWNPVDIPKMSLPPCHCLVQFYVQDNELSCQLYQRSGDVGLGIPFNIASYSILTHMIAHICKLKTGDFIHTLGDAHIYINHLEQLKIQITRKPRPFPTIKFLRDIDKIEDFKFEDIEIINYNPHPKLKMEMAI
jgi:thymidylate synthase